MQKPPIILTNATIYTPYQTVNQGTIVVENGKINYLGEKSPPNIHSEARILDLSDCLITPGLIDLHVHGAKGIDFFETAPQKWGPALQYHTSQGTTAFLATSISAPHTQLLDSIARVGNYCSQQPLGIAQCLGIHLEGPYLSNQCRGIHQTSYLRNPSSSEIQTYIDASQAWLKMLTLAPELDPNQEFVSKLTNQGIIVAGGHSAASYELTKQAIQSGLSYAVHTGNALSPLHQREPGILGAILEDKRVYCELIADGIHLHPVILNLFYKIKGSQKLVLATDSSPLAGLPKGTHPWQKSSLQVTPHKITNSDGKLAGSCLTMAQALKNMLQLNKCSFSEVLKMATINPARVLDLENRKGTLAVGVDADLVVFHPNLTVKLVMVGGNIV